MLLIGQDLGPAAKEINAAGCYLFPGGVDVHTHVDIELMGHRSIDDFYSGTVSAACGGVTTIVDYALPEPGQSIQASVEAWQKKGSLGSSGVVISCKNRRLQRTLRQDLAQNRPSTRTLVWKSFVNLGNRA